MSLAARSWYLERGTLLLLYLLGFDVRSWPPDDTVSVVYNLRIYGILLLPPEQKTDTTVLEAMKAQQRNGSKMLASFSLNSNEEDGE